MTYTRHGHHIPGTTTDDERGQVEKTKCGGIALCTDCQKDTNFAFLADKDYDPAQLLRELKEPENYDYILDKAKLFVVSSWNNQVNDCSQQFGVSDLRTVWFSKSLGNWKGLFISVSTAVPLYFEVTHNGEKQETYVDTYLKITNDKFSQEGE